MEQLQSEESVDESLHADRIKVCVRIRPVLGDEHEENLIWKWDNTTISVDRQNLNKCYSKKSGVAVGTVDYSSVATPSYKFDHVFPPDHTNSTIFETVVKPLIDQCMEGYHGSVFAYGQTSSGKTFTMTGTNAHPGIIPLAINHSFSLIQSYNNREFLFRVSYLEVYNEQVKDLLSSEPVQIKIQHGSKVGTIITGAKELVVLSTEQVMALLLAGDALRHVGATDMNEKSSRAHTIFRLTIESKERADEFSSAVRVSTLSLVDLAGSENAKMTNSSGERSLESRFINQSLLTLSTIVQRLSEDSVKAQHQQQATRAHSNGTPPSAATGTGAKSGDGGSGGDISGATSNLHSNHSSNNNMLSHARAHLPYRDSKLTRLMQASLSGSANIAIICTISPTWRCMEESHNTLKFAARAKNVRVDALKNEEALDDKAMLRVYRVEIEQLRARLAVLEKNGIDHPTDDPMSQRGRERGRRRRSLSLDTQKKGKEKAGNVTISYDQADDDEEEQSAILQMITEMERLILRADEPSASFAIASASAEPQRSTSSSQNQAQWRTPEGSPVLSVHAETSYHVRQHQERESGAYSPPLSPIAAAREGKERNGEGDGGANRDTGIAAAQEPVLPLSASLAFSTSSGDSDDDSDVDVWPVVSELTTILASAEAVSALSATATSSLLEFSSSLTPAQPSLSSLPAAAPAQVMQTPPPLASLPRPTKTVNRFGFERRSSSDGSNGAVSAVAMPSLKSQGQTQAFRQSGAEREREIVNPPSSSLSSFPLQQHRIEHAAGSAAAAREKDRQESGVPLAAVSCRVTTQVQTRDQNNGDSDINGHSSSRDSAAVLLLSVRHMLGMLKQRVVKRYNHPVETVSSLNMTENATATSRVIGSGRSFDSVSLPPPAPRSSALSFTQPKNSLAHSSRPPTVNTSPVPPSVERGNVPVGASDVSEPQSESHQSPAEALRHLQLDVRLKEADNRFLQEELRKKDELLSILTEGLRQIEIEQNRWLEENEWLANDLDETLWENATLKDELARMHEQLASYTDKEFDAQLTFAAHASSSAPVTDEGGRRCGNLVVAVAAPLSVSSCTSPGSATSGASFNSAGTSSTAGRVDAVAWVDVDSPRSGER